MLVFQGPFNNKRETALSNLTHLFPSNIWVLPKVCICMADFDHRLEPSRTGVRWEYAPSELGRALKGSSSYMIAPNEVCCQTVVWEEWASQRGRDWEGSDTLEPDNMVLSTVVAASIRRVSHGHRSQKAADLRCKPMTSDLGGPQNRHLGCDREHVLGGIPHAQRHSHYQINRN